MTIEQTKSEILTLARQKNACEFGYKQAERAETYDQSSIQTTVYGDGRADIKSYDHSQSKSTIKTCQSINL